MSDKNNRRGYVNDGMPSALMDKVASVDVSRGAPSAQMPRAPAPAPAPSPAPPAPTPTKGSK